jgi:hypothetical protein
MDNKQTSATPDPMIPGGYERGSAPPQQPAQVSPPIGTNPESPVDPTLNEDEIHQLRNESGGKL